VNLLLLTTDLPHGKLNMVYLAELLVVMTDRIKIVRICARNVTRIHRHKRLDDYVFLESLSFQESDSVMFSISTILLKHKNRLQTTCACLAVASIRKKVVATVCPLHFDTKSEQSDCNKSGVR